MCCALLTFCTSKINCFNLRFSTLNFCPVFGGKHNDPGLLTVILENLINNAIKFTNTGLITITAEKENGSAVIKVKDTGIGIEEKNYNKIFEEFRQVSEGVNREFQGTGLGLSITKKYVEMLHGSIKVESKLGVGTTFTILFPA